MGGVIDLAAVHTRRNLERAERLVGRVGELLGKDASRLESLEFTSRALAAIRQRNEIRDGVVVAEMRSCMRRELERELADGGSLESGVLMGCQRIRPALKILQQGEGGLAARVIAALNEDARVERHLPADLRAVVQA